MPLYDQARPWFRVSTLTSSVKEHKKHQRAGPSVTKQCRESWHSRTKENRLVIHLPSSASFTFFSSSSDRCSSNSKFFSLANDDCCAFLRILKSLSPCEDKAEILSFCPKLVDRARKHSFTTRQVHKAGLPSFPERSCVGKSRKRYPIREKLSRISSLTRDARQFFE